MIGAAKIIIHQISFKAEPCYLCVTSVGIPFNIITYFIFSNIFAAKGKSNMVIPITLSDNSYFTIRTYDIYVLRLIGERFFIIISPTKVFHSQIAQPVNASHSQLFMRIRISHNAGNEIRSYKEKTTPTLVIPLMLTVNIHIVLSLKIANYNHGAIHHFYGSLAITAIILPIHATFPAALIITHGHIIHRMYGKTQSTRDFFIIKHAGMRKAKILIAIKVIGIGDFTKNSRNLTTLIQRNGMLFIFWIRYLEGYTIIEVCGQSYRIHQLLKRIIKIYHILFMFITSSTKPIYV